MDSKQVKMLLLARMALSDGVTAPVEVAFIREAGARMGLEQSTVELMETARLTPLATLVGRLSKYEDRFVIALCAYLLINADEHYDFEEQINFESMVSLMNLRSDDVATIERARPDMNTEELLGLSDRLRTMVERSALI